ncbi:MAG: hypothetical protein KF845_14830 [Cyclobacteriaceae bacterium]|nr:hypothetical protein [Cyclobacteriaceae bacterium]
MNKLFLLTILLTTLSQCGQPKSKTVINELGNYSIDILPNWSYQVDSANLSLAKVKDSVKGVIHVSTLTSEYNTLDESMYHYLHDMTSFFQDARKIGDGVSDINGVKTIWYRMKASNNDMRQEVLLYNVQLDNRQLISLICVAREDKFKDFEEEFNQMVFSFKELK